MGSEAEDYSQLWDVELENDDGYVVTADLGDNSEIGDDGRRWYGGPSNGPIDITALPVSYSGGSVTSVSANFCAEDLTDSDGSDGYTFEFKCEDRESNTDGTEDAVVGEMLAISSAGTDGKIRGDNPFPAFVDFKGPTNSPLILANRNGREGGWINAAVALTGKYDADDDKDNWLFEGEGGEGEGGIGGYTMVLRIGEDLEKAVAATRSASPALPATSEDAMCAVASAMDDLGNESPLPDPDADDATCRAAPPAADTLYDDGGEIVYGQDIDGAASLSDQTLKFQVDVTAPTIELDGGPEDGGRYNTTTSIPTEVEGTEFLVDDDESDVVNSGVNEEPGSTPVMVSVSLRGEDNKTVCATISDQGAVDGSTVDMACDGAALATSLQLGFASPAVGDYMLSASVTDRAGNPASADPIAFVFDNEPADVTAPAVPFEIDAGESFQTGASLNDNLSIRDYYVTVSFGQDLELGVGVPMVVDGLNADPRTNRNHTVLTTVPKPYAGTQTSLGDGVQRISGVTVAVRDQTQDLYTESTGGTFPTVKAPADEDNFAADANFKVALSAGDVCVTGDTDDCMVDGDPTTTDIEFVATRATGTFRDPLERVDFWLQDVNGQSWLLGSDNTGTFGRNDDNDRTWTYSLDNVSGAKLQMVTRESGFPPEGINNSDKHTVRAFAVNGDGVALVVTKMVTIDDENETN